MAPPFAAATAQRLVHTRRIVVVDDDPTLVDALTDVLSEEGWEVDAYTDPEVALDRLIEGPAPSLVLLDYVMPRVDGDAFISSLCARRRDISIVVLSAMTGSPRTATNPCVVGVIRKPFELDHLLRTLDELVTPSSERRPGRS